LTVRETVALMGAANGLFSIAAIASMMRLAGHGREQREGTRVGLWGAAQAMAFGLGGLAGAAASDLARWLVADVGLAYSLVFAAESLLFVGAAVLAWQVSRLAPASAQELRPGPGTPAPAESALRGPSTPSSSHGLGAAPPRMAS
ncbi:MAG: hypothetical protein EBR46_06245, partial [Betaproteobacteria bacterium]|nr:hypothetical protein [Betaproteobacteria bacterium]